METAPPPPDPAAVAMVLGNDDLLIDILLHLDSPTWLVRAAAVCRRWLRRASDPAFLRRFRALNPPRVLGLYVKSGSLEPRYLAVPQPRELEAAAGRALASLSPFNCTQRRRKGHLWDCRNGRMLVEISAWPENVLVVRSLLKHVPAESEILPVPPEPGSFDVDCRRECMFLLEDDGDLTSCLKLTLSTYHSEVRADFSILQCGVWGTLQRAQIELEMVPGEGLPLQIMASQKLVAGRKVYMLTYKFILRLDLATNRFFTVDLPDGPGNYTLSRAQLSGLYLINAKKFELRVWHDEDSGGHWVLVDTISVREACGHLDVPKWEPDEEGYYPVWVVKAGDNAEFVFLQLMASGILCCMQLANRIAERVEGGTVPPNYSNSKHPISMVWPPNFLPLDETNNEE